MCQRVDLTMCQRVCISGRGEGGDFLLDEDV